MSHDMQIVSAGAARSSAIVPRRPIAIRLATAEDLPHLDALQKRHNKALGFFPHAQMEGYVRSGWVLVAHDPATGRVLGYCASRDRYLKRDELGVIYQLCVEPGIQRKLVGASLVKEVFARSAYGCRLYCCWCAQDLDANHFWESLGFVPIAFRAGSTGKRRVHIFWQKRIVEGDAETKWWYPSQTSSGAIREDRLVFPIPPGTHWSEVTAVSVAPGTRPVLEDASRKTSRQPRAKNVKGPVTTVATGLRFGPPPKAGASGKSTEKTNAPRAAKPKAKIDPKLVRAARELRDRWMERVNEDPSLLGPGARHDVTRTLEAPPAGAPLGRALPRALPRQLPAAA